MSKRKLNDEHDRKSKKQSVGHWAFGLLSAMDDPNLQVQADVDVVVIRDKFPKAKFHYLVLPRQKISHVNELRKSHLESLKHIHKIGLALAEQHSDHTFLCPCRLGYHAEPSMHHLHMHVISDDFESPCLKTKKHWNSFTTEHFIPSDKLIKDVSETGKARMISGLQCKELLGKDLQCHKCSFKPKNMPQLKEHLKTHSSNKSKGS